MRKKGVLAAFVVGAALVVSQAQAGIVTYQATGTVNAGSVDSDNGFLSTLFGSVTAGDDVTFTFSIDDSNVVGTLPYSSIYEVVGDTFLSVNGSPSVAMNGLLLDRATVRNGPPGQDSFTLFSGPLQNNRVKLELSGPSLWSSTALPDLGLYNTFLLTFWARNGSLNPNDSFTATMSEVSAVPLPAAAWLLLSGLAGVGAFARRRRTGAAAAA